MTDSKLVAAKRYREKFAPKADQLFEKILPCDSCVGITGPLTILVIGAGSFPSYQSLLNRLKRTNPTLDKISFTLVEPIKSQTDFFLEHFADSTHDFFIYHGNLKDFFKEHTDKKFDLIYFEHPETMALPILLSAIGMSRFKRVPSLRASMPDLAAVVKTNTLIIASCMTRHELKQLQMLLNYSLKIKPEHVASRLWHIFYGGPYSEGLTYCIKQTSRCAVLQQKKTALIRFSDYSLSFVLFLALIIYILYCSQYPDDAHALERLVAVLLMGAQLYFHRPGKSGFAIKCLLLATQLSLF